MTPPPAAGEVAIDTNTDNSNITQGSITYYDGTRQMWVIAVDALPTTALVERGIHFRLLERRTGEIMTAGPKTVSPDLLAQAEAASPAEEQSVLARALRPDAPPSETGPREIAPGLWLHRTGSPKTPRLTLSGPRLDDALQARLEDWLKSQG
mgnify:CR=1 FL=1